MGRMDDERLASSLGRPELGRLVQALRRRLELGRPLTGRLTLSGASFAERAACDALLGRRPTAGDTLSVDLDALAGCLARAGICGDLRLAVEALTGAAPNRPAAAARHRAAWDAVWVQAGMLPEFVRQAPLDPWLRDLRGTGLLRRLCGDDPAAAGHVLRDLATLLAVLPSSAEPLASLAARIFGDAHALDPGTTLATLAVRAAACVGGTRLEDDAEGRRAAWAGVGVLCDELSSPAIAFRLMPATDDPLGRLLRSAAADAEPIHISLRLLLRYPLSADPGLRGREVFACENPTIVGMAAQRLGSRCRSLICVNGQFATPALVLLRQLRQAGVRVRYHGDFDPAGLAIARRVFVEAAAEPWRFGVDDYLAAEKGVAFDGEPGPTPWSPPLSDAMRTAGRAIHEEAIFETLAKDLEQTEPALPFPTFPYG